MEEPPKNVRYLQELPIIRLYRKNVITSALVSRHIIEERHVAGIQLAIAS